MTVKAELVEPRSFLKDTQWQLFLKAIAAGALRVAALDTLGQQRLIALVIKYDDIDADSAELVLI